MGRIKVGVMSKIIPPSPYPSPPMGEGRPFIPPAELGGILAHFYKRNVEVYRFKSSMLCKCVRSRITGRSQYPIWSYLAD